MLLILIFLSNVYSYLYFNCTTENGTKILCQYWLIKRNCDKCNKVIGAGDNTYCICYYPYTTNHSSNFNCSEECGFICTNFCDLNILDTDTLDTDTYDTFDTNEDTFDTDTLHTENDTFTDSFNSGVSDLEIIIISTVLTIVLILVCFIGGCVGVLLLRYIILNKKKKSELKLTTNNNSIDKIMEDIEMEDLECKSSNIEEPTLINNLKNSDFFLENEKKKKKD